MRKQNYLICAAVAVAVTAQFAKAAIGTDDHWDYDSRYTVKDVQTVKNTFSLPSGKLSIEVDNVFGSIEVVGTSGDQVQMTVTQTYRGETQDKIAQAKKEVSLDVTNESGVLKL